MGIDLQKIKARLIANTRRKKRADDLITIANIIDELKDHFGSLKKVSEEVSDISPNMLTRFLSVLNIDERIIPLVKNREIDNINALYYLQTLEAKDQLLLANLLVEGRLNSKDVRAISPIKKRFPEKPIREIVDSVLDSKDRKRYLVKFDFTRNINLKTVETQLKKILLAKDFEIICEGKVGTIIFSKFGYRAILDYCSAQDISFKKFINGIISEK